MLLSVGQTGRNNHISILLPNGPKLVVYLITIIVYATCAPINPNDMTEEIKAELSDIRDRTAVSSDKDTMHITSAALAFWLAVLALRPLPCKCGVFEVFGLVTLEVPPGVWPVCKPACLDEVALVRAAHQWHRREKEGRPSRAPWPRLQCGVRCRELAAGA